MIATKAKPIRKMEVNKIEGDDTSLSLHLEWPKTLPVEQSSEIWRGLGIMLAAVLTPAECRRLLRKLRAAQRGPCQPRV